MYLSKNSDILLATGGYIKGNAYGMIPYLLLGGQSLVSSHSKDNYTDPKSETII